VKPDGEDYLARTEAVDKLPCKRQTERSHYGVQGESKRNCAASGMEFLNQRLEKHSKRKAHDWSGPKEQAHCGNQDHPPAVKQSIAGLSHSAPRIAKASD
jgi:hypothetical protein